MKNANLSTSAASLDMIPEKSLRAYVWAVGFFALAYYTIRSTIMTFMVEGSFASSASSSHVWGYKLLHAMGSFSTSAPEPYAREAFQVFMLLFSIMPFLGAFLYDRFLDARSIIITSSVGMLSGLALMLIPQTFLLGLILFASGAGFYRVVLLLRIGRLFPVSDTKRELSYFYAVLALSLGAFVAGFFGPPLIERYSELAFLLCAASIVLGFGAFLRAEQQRKGLADPQSQPDVSASERSGAHRRQWLIFLFVLLGIGALFDAEHAPIAKLSFSSSPLPVFPFVSFAVLLVLTFLWKRRARAELDKPLLAKFRQVFLGFAAAACVGLVGHMAFEGYYREGVYLLAQTIVSAAGTIFSAIVWSELVKRGSRAYAASTLALIFLPGYLAQRIMEWLPLFQEPQQYAVYLLPLLALIALLTVIVIKKAQRVLVEPLGTAA